MSKEKSFKNSSEFAESIVDTEIEPLIVLDQKLRVISANRSFFKLFRVKSKDTYGRLIYDLGNKQWDIPKLRELLETILPQKTILSDYKVEHYFSDLGRRIMLFHARQIERVEGKDKITLLAIEDITVKELAREDAKERFRQLFETTKDGLVLVEKKNCRIVNVNRTFCKLLGYEQYEIIGKQLKELDLSIDLDDIDIILEEIAVAGLVSYDDILVKNKQGTEIAIDLRLVDRSRFLQCNFRDLTERKLAEKKKELLKVQLSKAQQMETVGILAGGIAHNFNNILSIILGNAQLALDDMSPKNPLKLNIDEIFKASIRAKKLVNQVLTFSRKNKPSLIAVHPQSMINETMQLLRSSTPETITIIQDISKNCRAIMTDIAQFHQIIVKLFVNAVQAVDRKGEVIVTLKEVNLNSNDFTNFPMMIPRTAKKPGAFAKFSVADTGGGIDPKIIEKIFDPFFTAKQIGKGTGMGLSVVHAAVQNQGGFITVESSEGKGSKFSVFTPIASEEEIRGVDKNKLAQVGTEQIIAMDDEETEKESSRKMAN